MYNQDIRQTATESNVKLWRIAEAQHLYRIYKGPKSSERKV